MWAVPLALLWVGYNRSFRFLAWPLPTLNQWLQPSTLYSLASQPCPKPSSLPLAQWYRRIFKRGQNLYPISTPCLCCPLCPNYLHLPHTHTFLFKSSLPLTIQLQPHLLQEALHAPPV